MDEKISKEDVQNAIAQVKHPAIDSTLLDLGIVKDISVNEKKVTITLAFPFPDIPIKDHLVNSVKNPIKKLGVEVEVKITVMSQDELEKFLAMEQRYWEGGM